MSEKEKVKNSPRRFNFWKFLLSSFVAFVVLIIVLIIFGPIIGGGNITQTSLDAQYVPTAEYLLVNPMPNPHNLALHIEQNGSHGDTIDYETFCIHLMVPIQHRFDIVQFDFDRIPVWGTFFSGTLEGFGGPDSYLDKFCIGGSAATGVHLVTVHLNNEVFSEPYTYEWAVEIDNDGYNYYSLPDY